MLNVRQMNSFKRDLKRLRKSQLDLPKLDNVVGVLALKQPLEPRNKDHSLVGNWKGYRECHVAPDWLLIYVIVNDELWLVRTGTHSDLF